jgi:hypothetical protein
MKLHQIDKLIDEDYALVANCIGNGKYISSSIEGTRTTYQNCKVVKIEHRQFFGRGLTIWIEPTIKLQKELCQNCAWDNCINNPSYDIYKLYGIQRPTDNK